MARYIYQFPRPMVTADVILFAWINSSLVVLLVKRKHPPYRGYWALPGGFVDENESLEEAAQRELEEETGISKVDLEQLYTFGELGRDPRGRTITVTYYAIVRPEHLKGVTKAGSDAAAVQWFSVNGLSRLAFDHRNILDYALDRLRNKLEYTTAGFQLLSKKFTLTELQDVYEAILGRKLDKRNFRKKILSLKILYQLRERECHVPHRPARLYALAEHRFQDPKDRGIIFPL